MKLNFSKYSPIIAVFIFGSLARKDADENSDLDLCIISEDLPFSILTWLREKIATKLRVSQKSIVIYTDSDLAQMSKKGSLFLWHLKLEGKIIYLKRRNKLIKNCFDNLTPYNNYNEDLKTYSALLNDAKKNILDNGEINEFDLALIFTVARNTCMLICYYKGVPRFGRKNVFLTAESIFRDKFPLEKKTYLDLSRWKLCYERGRKIKKQMPNLTDVTTIIEDVSGLIKFARRELNVNARKKSKLTN